MQRLWCFWVLVGFFVACGGGEQQGATAPKVLRPLDGAPKPTTGAPLASLPKGTVGPFLAPANRTWVAVWAAPTDGDGLFWFSRAVHEDGVPVDPPRRLGRAAEGIRLVRVRSLGKRGVAVAFTAEGENADGDIEQQVQVMYLGAHGQLTQAPRVVAQSSQELVWVDLATNSGGELVWWAERAGDRAELFTRKVGGDQLGEVVDAASGVRGWQVLGTPDGALLATVSAKGDVGLLTLDQSGEPGKTTAVSDAAGDNEIDLAAAGDAYVLAFNQTTRFQTRVVTALVSSNGQLLTMPAAATDALGDQALVKLVGGSQAQLVWQNVDSEPGFFRSAHLSKAGTTTGGELLVPVNPGSPAPLFARTPTGPAVLMWGCPRGNDCPAEVPLLVRAGPDLSPTSVDPWVLEGGTDLAWSLECERQTCMGLAARFGDPTEVFALGARPRKGQWATPVWVEEKSPPRAISATAAIATPDLAALDAATFGGGRLISWLSYFDPATPYEKPDRPAPDGRYKPIRALLKTQWLPEDWTQSSAQLPESEVISYRARSVGGLDLATKESSALLAWSALDGEHPQVFTTLLSPKGQKVSQKMQTRSKGEVHTIRAAAAKYGWVVGWTDEREGKPRAYVARLLDNLNRSTPDVALLDADSEVSGLDLATVDREVWVLLTARQSVHLLRLDDQRLRPATEPLELARGHHFDEPVLALGARKWAVWLERGAQAGRVLLSDLSEPGEPWALEVPGVPERMVARCGTSDCYLVLSAHTEQGPVLLGAVLGKGAQLRKLLTLSSPLSTAVAPTISEDHGVWQFDSIPSAGNRGVHFVEVAWR